MRIRLIIHLLALGCCLPLSALAQRDTSASSRSTAKRPIVAVFDIQDSGAVLNKEQREQLSEMLVSTLGAGGVYRIVPRAQLRGRLRSQKLASYKKCVDESCQIAVGRELAAQKSLVSKILRIGKTCTFTVMLYDLKTGTSEGGGNRTGPCTIESIASSLRAVVPKLERLQRPASATKPTRAAPPKRRTPPPPAAKRRPSGPLSNERLRLTTGNETRAFDVTIISSLGEVRTCRLSITSPCTLPRIALGKTRVLIKSEGLYSFAKAITLDGEGAKDEWKTIKVTSRPHALSIVGWSLGGVALGTGIALGAVGAGVDSGPLVTAGIITGSVGALVLIGSFYIRSTVDAQTGFLNLGWDFTSRPKRRGRSWALYPTLGGAMVHARW